MTRTLLAITLLAAFTRTAAADEPAPTPAGKMVEDVAWLLTGDDQFAKPTWTYDQTDIKKLVTPAACVAATKDLADDAKLHGPNVSRLPNAQKDDAGPYITGAAAKALCATYATRYAHDVVETALVFAYLARDTMKQPVEGMYESEANAVGIEGKTCADAVAAAIAAGLPATEPIESKRYGMPAVTLGDANATYCQPAIDFAVKRVAEIKGAATAKQDAIIAVYKKAGIKGKRLDLYVSYGMPDNTGFFAAGCESYVTSLPALKKAKKLFVWLEGNDGYTIRTFTFHGDDYTVTEHSYDTQAQAYRGCR